MSLDLREVERVIAWQDAIANTLAEHGNDAGAAVVREGRNTLVALLAALEEARQLLGELADDVASEVLARYGSPVHPALRLRYDRDMDVVLRARTLLAGPPRVEVPRVAGHKEQCVLDAGHAGPCLPSAAERPPAEPMLFCI